MSRLDDSQVNLQNLLRELAATEPPPVSAALESRLRFACRARREQRLRRRLLSIALAACLLLIFAGVWRLRSRPASPEANYAGFIALPYAESGVPMEQVVIVRVNLQPAEFRALGLPPSLLAGKSPTPADLLIGQDGIARAVRFTR